MPDFSIEQSYNGPVCGIDEVGRGPLAGPVVAACVHVPAAVCALPFWDQVDDSKLLAPDLRRTLAEHIRKHTLWGLGLATVEEIDRVNILQATFLSMRRAYDNMMSSLPSVIPASLTVIPAQAGIQSIQSQPAKLTDSIYGQAPVFTGATMSLALIDGNRTPPGFPVPVQTIIKGDQKSLSIAAASILAKVVRDQMMEELAQDFPVYGWDQNAGYGTAGHLQALAANGPCPHHRKSFGPVREMMR